MRGKELIVANLCETCVKRRNAENCFALDRMIGDACWAYCNDPNWKAWRQRCEVAYGQGWRGAETLAEWELMWEKEREERREAAKGHRGRPIKVAAG